ncbi:hypothetical protein PHYSODRAFT_479540 [Phytophthora sojae]|uniref:Uncharacterized protein n=1 Tax=Phytophthora sojae (strain P6497) TaxID=1094619 RepID=G4YVP1_PHYSP|nr:hypothetical protein PHYSODRAFT_479540 [Phytophthora sojae]EGZ26073.1 hypothetical protein PHYSODRAFT_479540 [Phytophthora sojae]|eukprot:XP_009521361.1 hypothetical protein PHYSODRAFT_479540 [Phytophthora sojae]
MADDVEALKRELEALKLQLEQERKKNTAAAADSPQQKPERVAQRDQSAKSKRRGGDTTASTAPKEQCVYVQHAAVGARRGKWWLRDRQVLPRSASEDGGGGETLKVRETWVWSGRAVVLDKIVRLDDEEEDEQEPAELEQAKPEAKQPNDADITSAVPVEVAAAPSETSPQQEQQSDAAETTKSGEDAAPVDAPAENVAQEVTTPPPPTPAKADDEVRESSATTAKLPVIDSTSLPIAVDTNS